jgi:hypothetical protein
MASRRDGPAASLQDGPNSIHVGARVSVQVLRELEELARRNAKPGLPVRLSGAVRMAIVAGLRALNEAVPERKKP